MQQLCFFHDNPSYKLLMENQVKSSTHPFIIKHVSRDLPLNKTMPYSMRLKLKWRKGNAFLSALSWCYLTESRCACYFYILTQVILEHFHRVHTPRQSAADVVLWSRSSVQPALADDRCLMTYMFVLPGPKCPFMAIHAHVCDIVTLNTGEYRWMACLWETSSSQRPASPNIQSLYCQSHTVKAQSLESERGSDNSDIHA